ncbi:glycine betaine ABC transporter substrate-binding protein [Mesorhizobium sp. GR13]|uniref:ABC transporter substrate-binding protein n=1 Tax=Mesorhizobium sp. GR13 TaxID=2562308 RepID=UPI0010C0771C|nr:glycine betaine ABC transporter substrate-binding protein [Mesorhizobium sp. GR13]
MHKYLKVPLVSALTILTLHFNASAADVVIGIPNWTSAAVTGEMIRYIAKTDLGLDVGTTPGTNTVIFEAMGVGKGDIDVHPEVWLPNQANLSDQYIEKDATVAFAAEPYQARQGICTTRYAAEALGIKSVYDLANPEISAHFDTNGDGKGEFWPGAQGWNSTNVEMVRARDYGYDKFWELVPTDESIYYADMINAAGSKRFKIGICQEPNYVFSKLDLVWLEEPQYDANAWVMKQPSEDPDWLKHSHVATAWPPTILRIAYSKTLKERTPEFVALLDKIHLDIAIVSSWTAMVAVDGLTSEEAAKKWVDDNRETVNRWLGL